MEFNSRLNGVNSMKQEHWRKRKLTYNKKNPNLLNYINVVGYKGGLSQGGTLRVEHLVRQLQNGGYDHEAVLLAHAQSCYFALTLWSHCEGYCDGSD